MMSTRKYRLLAIPADEWQELNDILVSAGYKTGGGFGSQRGQAVMEILRKAAARPTPILSDAEYRAEISASDARLLEERLSAPWLDAKGRE